jgi:serine/threonine-protein phosphatase 2B regulatory subunit
MDQPAEPNTAAMHNVQRRRGSVGTTQLFDNIVSTSNCMFTGLRRRNKARWNLPTLELTPRNSQP